MASNGTLFAYEGFFCTACDLATRKITAKKGTGFYIRAAATFLRGTDEKPPVPSVILSGGLAALLEDFFQDISSRVSRAGMVVSLSSTFTLVSIVQLYSISQLSFLVCRFAGMPPYLIDIPDHTSLPVVSCS